MRTDYLFAVPTFWSGVASAIDLFGVLDSYNNSPNEAEADARALYADWVIVGQDVAHAVRVIDNGANEGTEASSSATEELAAAQ